MTLKPTGTNLLVTIHEARQTDIIVPDSASFQPYAIIVDVGPDHTTFHPGEKVLFHLEHAIAKVMVGMTPHYLVSEGNVFARYID